MDTEKLVDALDNMTAAFENVLLHLGNKMTEADLKGRKELVKEARELLNKEIKYYLLVIWNNTGPDLIGPLGSWEEIVAESKKIENISDEHGLYSLIIENGSPSVEPFEE